jgi:hypothetical protein
MPKSRKRPHTKNRRVRKWLDPLALDRMFDKAEGSTSDIEVPRVLYHYTSWEGAKGIISSQQFWATAHDCTNDEAELVSADSVIVEVANELRKNAFGAAAKVLDLFVAEYPQKQIATMITVCLACFSVARHATLVPHASRAQLKERASAGQVKQYLPITVRAGGKRIAFSEIIIGPNRSVEETREQLTQLLKEAGYKEGDEEYPEIGISALPS